MNQLQNNMLLFLNSKSIEEIEEEEQKQKEKRKKVIAKTISKLKELKTKNSTQ